MNTFHPIVVYYTRRMFNCHPATISEFSSAIAAGNKRRMYIGSDTPTPSTTIPYQERADATMTTQISVVVCTRNEEEMIETCLQNLTDQWIRPEIIVVDGHSEDQTLPIAERYADQILSDQGGGISEARNIGWRAAKSPIVAFCDADSRPPEDWTRNILARMTPEVIGVSGPLSAYDGPTVTRLNIRIWANWFPRLLGSLGYGSIWGANMGFRRSILEQYPFRLRFLEDYDMGRRLRHCQRGLLCFDPALSMPISSRRFKNGFYPVVIGFYLRTVILMDLFNRYDFCGYYLPKPSSEDTLTPALRK